MFGQSILLGALMLVVPIQSHAIDTIVPVGAATRLQVVNHTGSVDVKVWDRPDIQIRASSAADELFEVEALGSVVRVRPSHLVPFQAPSHRDRGSMSLGSSPMSSREDRSRRMDFEITMPRTLQLEVITVVSDVSVSGVQGGTRINLVNGTVDVDGSAGAIDVDAWNADIVVSRTDGRLDLSNMAGEIRVIDGAGDLRVESVNGSISARGRFSDAELTTYAESITFQGPLVDGGRYHLSTHSGTIDLTLAEPVSVSMLLTAPPGGLHATFPLPDASQSRGSTTEIMLGSGSAFLSAVTHRGLIRLNREGG